MSAGAIPSHIRLTEVTPGAYASRLMPEDIARRYCMVPLWVEADELVVACADPYNRQQIHDAAREIRRRIRPVQAGYKAIQDAIDQLYNHPVRQDELPDPGEILLTLGYLTEDELSKVWEIQHRTGEAVEKISRQLHLVGDGPLVEVRALQGYLPHLRLDKLSPRPTVSLFIPWEVVQKEKMLPLWWLGNTLLVGVYDIPDDSRLAQLAEQMGFPLIPVLCPRDAWERVSRQLYLHGRQSSKLDERQIAEWLVQKRKLPAYDFDTALSAHRQTGKSLENILLENGLVSRDAWMDAKAQLYGIPLARWQKGLKNGRITNDTLSLLPLALARYLGFAPLSENEQGLVIGVTAPDILLNQLVGQITGLAVHAHLMHPADVQSRLSELYAAQGKIPYGSVPKLGNLLRLLDMISPDQMQEVLTKVATSDRHLGQQLLESGYLDELDLAEMLSLQTGIPYLSLNHARLNTELISKFPAELLVQYNILPLWENQQSLWIATSDPFDSRALQTAEKSSGKHVLPVIVPRLVLIAILDRLLISLAGTGYNRQAHALVAKMVDAGFLTQASASQALSLFEVEHLPLDQAICQASGRQEIELAQYVAKTDHIELVSLQLVEHSARMLDPLGKMVERRMSQDPVDVAAAQLLNLDTATRLSALPVRFEGSSVVVAFANPLYHPTLEEIASILGRKIIPAACTRHELDDAIQRNLGKRNLGTHLLLEGVISRAQLNQALNYAHRTGVRLGRALISLRFITWEQLYEQLSHQSAIPFYSLADIELDTNVANQMDAGIARKHGVLSVQTHEDQVTVALVDPYDEQAKQIAAEKFPGKIRFILMTEKDFDTALERVFSQDYLDRSISELLERSPEDSAFRVLSKGQIVFLILFILGSIIWLVFNAWGYLIFLNAIFSTFYLVFSAYRFYLIYRALSTNLDVQVTPEEIAALRDSDLPVYTILIPVYQEADVLPDLLTALNRMDYPKTKLDIKILMEEDDQETIQAFNDWNPPSHFHGIIVPYGQPKTKPKACNYGLIHARGEYTVIYDAEDLPDADQLKKIVVAFTKVPRDVVCIQSKLNYYNQRQNLLTRWFTVEYSMWFDLFLPGLDASSAPIPLGGTSNHFRTEALVDAGAWDPYNVTEDADLGIRLYKRGYKTAIIDSTTYEEANSQIYNWIRQRSRWVKGYIQTWLVHMRHPLRLWRETGWKGFWGFQFTVGGSFLPVLLNPIYWLMTTLWFWKEFQFIHIIFPGVIYIFGAFCLFVGNFAFTYMNVAGAMRRGYYDMVKYALLSPIYWGLTSVAGWKGFIQLLTQPHYWEKTQHGLHIGQVEANLTNQQEGTQGEQQ